MANQHICIFKYNCIQNGGGDIIKCLSIAINNAQHSNKELQQGKVQLQKLGRTHLLLDTTIYKFQSLFAMLVMSSSLHIEFNELYRSIFISNLLISTDPDLNVISCGRRQLYIEPWWRVEGATGASGATSLSIPQGVTIWPETESTSIPQSYA